MRKTGLAVALAFAVGAVAFASPARAQTEFDNFSRNAITSLDAQLRSLQAGGIPVPFTRPNGRVVTMIVKREDFIDALTVSVLTGDTRQDEIAAIVRAADARRRTQITAITRLRGQYAASVERESRPLPALPWRRPPTAAQPGQRPLRVIQAPTQRDAWISGTYRSTFGTMTFGPGGGTYESPVGSRLSVTSLNGTVVEGYWIQTRSAKRCTSGGAGEYSGRFHFEFTESGFSGNWGYCDSVSDGGGWSGTKIR